MAKSLLTAFNPYRRQLGAFYTPQSLADWVAEEVLSYLTVSGRDSLQVLDPACGDGSLLKAIQRKAPGSVKLIGVDIDPDAAQLANSSLGPAARIFVGDSLTDLRPYQGLSPDVVIANPPWGAELATSRNSYRENGFELACGQFDISDLFVEKMLKSVPQGALLAFILPDGVFQPDHQPLRRVLLQHTILLLARLGEGIFEGVFRGTTVIILRKSRATRDHKVACFQVPPPYRKCVGDGSLSLSVIKSAHSHLVSQSRFLANPHLEFNILQDENGYGSFKKLSELPPFNWSQWIYMGRGIEIGKKGKVVQCSNCGKYRPAPTSLLDSRCPHCKAATGLSAAQESIVSDNPEMKLPWYPLIVGEDVDRYSALPKRSIRLDVPGIRYKPIEHFCARKLLIRKTGVGIRAAIDGSKSAVTQSVFYLLVKSLECEWILDYIQGIVNSRPLLAWYLRWSGESHWRSHPYITPSILKRLPIPDPFANGTATRIAIAIAAESRITRSGSAESDRAVDHLVSKLYCLDTRDINWIKNSLNETDNLGYFKRMRESYDPKVTP